MFFVGCQNRLIYAPEVIEKNTNFNIKKTEKINLLLVPVENKQSMMNKTYW